MATNYNPKNVTITVGGVPLHIHPGNFDLASVPPAFLVAPIRPVTAPVFVNGELVLSRRGRRALARLLGRPLIDRTKHPMRFHSAPQGQNTEFAGLFEQFLTSE